MEFFQFRNVPDIQRFPTVHMAETRFLLDNLGISDPSLVKIPTSVSFPQYKYNCAVLSLGQIYWLFMYVSKYILS